ncbi:hypothetical protein FOMPIDRAFT_1054198 [Fomitopsis schrenkii]|uniref:Uncharacterized protein n=1 Tax=Fomitopsis schrenkii TaxID=2126942 RepID=S8DPZ0_FOMSC|nr:hypothetical protein FOMPIDRAFT_1054198 [Fomitopsis schrenkii]
MSSEHGAGHACFDAENASAPGRGRDGGRVHETRRALDDPAVCDARKLRYAPHQDRRDTLYLRIEVHAALFSMNGDAEICGVPLPASSASLSYSLPVYRDRSLRTCLCPRLRESDRAPGSLIQSPTCRPPCAPGAAQGYGSTTRVGPVRAPRMPRATPVQPRHAPADIREAAAPPYAPSLLASLPTKWPK